MVDSTFDFIIIMINKPVTKLMVTIGSFITMDKMIKEVIKNMINTLMVNKLNYYIVINFEGIQIIEIGYYTSSINSNSTMVSYFLQDSLFTQEYVEISFSFQQKDLK